MESRSEQYLAVEWLMMQLAEGVDEVILPAPVDRFVPRAIEVEESVSIPKSDISTNAGSVEKRNIDQAINIEELCEVMRENISPELVSGAHYQFELVGDEHAEIAVIVDPPSQQSNRDEDFFTDLNMSLLLKSLEAINIGLDTRSGKEPFLKAAFLPISPWRIAQDRKLVDRNGRLFAESLKRRIEMRNFQYILLAGTNLAGIDKQIQSNLLFDLPVTSLISPKLMRSEPILKGRQWQLLCDLWVKLQEVRQL